MGSSCEICSPETEILWFRYLNIWIECGPILFLPMELRWNKLPRLYTLLRWFVFSTVLIIIFPVKSAQQNERLRTGHWPRCVNIYSVCFIYSNVSVAYSKSQVKYPSRFFGYIFILEYLFIWYSALDSPTAKTGQNLTLLLAGSTMKFANLARIKTGTPDPRHITGDLSELRAARKLDKSCCLLRSYGMKAFLVITQPKLGKKSGESRLFW